MRIIHCTQKLLKQLNRDITPADKTPANSEGLGNWYANLLWFNRKKCILFTNEKTLYTFLIPKVVKKNFGEIEGEFLTHLSYNLQKEGISLEVISKVQQEYSEIGFAKTTNRSVLSSMNKLAYLCECYIIDGGGIEKARILQINHKMNRIPMIVLKYLNPIEALKNLLHL
jgi:hypothetical protein